MALFSGSGLNVSLKGVATNRITLPSGGASVISPAGWYAIGLGKYTTIQQYDPITNLWSNIGASGDGASIQYTYSDGVNYRLANQTGSAVGALMTNAGSGYTSAPTVAASAGGSIWRAIVGGAVNTTITITNAGTNYTYPPLVQFSAPPQGGVQATGHTTLSGSTVGSVVVDNQGAGYTTAPTIVFFNDSREGLNNTTVGYNAAAVATLTGSGTITSLLCLDHGQGSLTALPTLAFSGGGGASAAATTIMCWTITAYAVTGGGTGWTTAPLVTALDNFPTGGTGTNPATQSTLVAVRNATIRGAVSAGAITATGQVVYDGGIYTSVPTIEIINTGILITATAALTATMGGALDTSYITQY